MQTKDSRIITEAEQIHWLEVKLGIAIGVAIVSSITCYVIGYFWGR